MRCKNCGSENEDNLYICQNCGSPLYDEDDNDALAEDEMGKTKVVPAVAGSSRGTAQPAHTSRTNAEKDEKQKQKEKTIAVIVILAVVLAVVVGVLEVSLDLLLRHNLPIAVVLLRVRIFKFGRLVSAVIDAGLGLAPQRSVEEVAAGVHVFAVAFQLIDELRGVHRVVTGRVAGYRGQCPFIVRAAVPVESRAAGRFFHIGEILALSLPGSVFERAMDGVVSVGQLRQSHRQADSEHHALRAPIAAGIEKQVLPYVVEIKVRLAGSSFRKKQIDVFAWSVELTLSDNVLLLSMNGNA